MIGKINKSGSLIIKRGNDWVMQYCLHRRNCFCGLECPAFRSPVLKGTSHSLQLCKEVGVLQFDTFSDEWIK